MHEHSTTRTDRSPWLDRDACLSLLATASMARLAVSLNALPHIVLADFRLIDLADTPEVIIRVAAGAKLLDAFRQSVVAAEAEHLDPADQTGWVVVLQGTSRVMADPGEIAAAASAFETADDLPHRFAAIRSDRVHGHLVRGLEPLTPTDSHLGLLQPDPSWAITPQG